MKKFFLLALVLALPLSVSGLGQRPSTQAPKQNQPQQEKDDDKVVRLGVTLVQVDAIVTDKKGQQVTDLQASDFEIFEDGRPQQITNFSYITTQPYSETAPTVAPAPSSGRNAVPLPPIRLRPDQVRRTIALVVDDLTLSFESTYYTREALKKFVDNQMQPGDMVAIVRTGAGIGALQQFTADKRQLYAAIERVRWTPFGRGRIGAFSPIGSSLLPDLPPALAANEGRDQEEVMEEFRASIFSVGTLGAVNFVVRGLRDLPGRKSVILFSEGFRLFTQGRDNTRVLESIRRLIDQANRASVVIYTVDSRGLQYTGLTPSDSVAGRSLEDIESRLQDRRAELFETQAGLSYLAHETGGFSIRNSNDLSGGVERVLNDQKGYYLIGYIPEESTFKPRPGRRNFHKITLKVRRPGLEVRSRKGFYGIADEEMSTPRNSGRGQLFSALTSPFASGDVSLRLTSVFGHHDRLGPFVRSMLHVDMHNILFTEEPNGVHKAIFEILVATFGDNGIMVDGKGTSYTLEVPDDVFQKLQKEGLVYSLLVPIKKPGAYQLRAAVRDARSARIGSANQYIEIPDVKRKRLTLSGIILSKGGDQPTGDDTDEVVDSAGGKAIQQTSSVLRRFLSSDTIEYSFLIFNAKQEKKQPPQIETRTVLLRDGKVLYSGPPTPLKPGERSEGNRLFVGGALTLSPDTKPGEYVLQVVITDKLAKKKYNTVTQWIDFEIVR